MIRNITRDCNSELSWAVVDEIVSTGDTKVVCPYCSVKPEFNMTYSPLTKQLERIVGGCKCGYIRHCVVSLSFTDFDNDKKFSNGYRKLSKEPLTDSEIKMVIEAAKSIDIPEDILVFNDERYLNSVNGTCYNFMDDKIYITQNVFPDVYYSNHPRDQLSIRAVLAHEYYGHRPFREEYISDYESGNETKIYWEDEARASIQAAKFAPNLTQLERAMLINEARHRAYEFSQNLELDDYMKNMLYGDGTAKPIAIPLSFVALGDIESDFKHKVFDLFGIDLAQINVNEMATEPEVDDDIDI